MILLGLLFLALVAVEPLAAQLPPGSTAQVRIGSGAALWDSPLGPALADISDQHAEVRNLRQYIEAVIERDVGSALRDALGGEIELGLYPAVPDRDDRRGPPRRHLLISARARSAAALERALDDALVVLDGLDVRIRRRPYRDEQVIHLGRSVMLAQRRDRLYLATHGELLAKALDGQRAARRSRPRPTRGLAEFTLAFDPITDREMQRVTARGGRLQRQLASPLLSAIFGQVAGTVLGGGTLTGWVEETEGRLRLVARLPAAATPSIPDTLPADANQVAVLPRTTGTLATLHFERDLASWWRQREEVLPEELQTRLARFDNNMSMLFSGASLADDIFARIGSPLGVVVGRQTYEREPDIRLPAACLVAPLRDAEDFEGSLQVAFQTFVGLINADRGQDGEAPFLIETERDDGLYACYARRLPRGDEPVSIEANLSPALAVVGDTLLLGTSSDQVQRLAKALQQQQVTEQRGQLGLRVDGVGVAALAADNRGALVAEGVLEKGLDPAEAAAEVDGLLMLLQHIEELSLSLDAGGDAYELALEVTLAPGAP